MSLTKYQEQQMTFSMPSAVEMDSLIKFCQVMAHSPFYAKLGAGGVMAVYLTCKERNLPFMSCLNGGLHTFDGKITYSAILVSSMIVAAGHTCDVIHLDNSYCEILFKRGDRREKDYKGFTYRYTVEQAEKAGYLSKKNWQTSLQDMLWARCLTGGGRKHVPEVFIGILVAGELTGTDVDGDVIACPAPEPTAAEKPLKLENKISPEEKANIPTLKNPGFDEFKNNQFNEKGELFNSFVKECMEKMKKSEIHVINSAMFHVEKFNTAFEGWKKKTSVDESTEPENSALPTEAI